MKISCISKEIYRASSDGDAACKTIIEDIISKVPRTIETGFGPAARHMTFENALLRIGDKLGNHFVFPILTFEFFI